MRQTNKQIEDSHTKRYLSVDIILRIKLIRGERLVSRFKINLSLFFLSDKSNV